MKLIRFTQKAEYLLDEIANGFFMNEHKVTFKNAEKYVLNKLVNTFEKSNLTIGVIGAIANIKKSGGTEDDFNRYLNENPDDKVMLNMILSSTRYDISMKCFTELRDNQKMHPHHVGYFGDYGISLKEDWAIENGATQVIYVGKEDEMSKRIGFIQSFIKSMFAGSIEVQSALIDLMSFVELSDHKYEYEYRIVNNNRIDGNQFERLVFPISAISEIFIPDDGIKNTLTNLLEEKAERENYTLDLPNIKLVSDILLSDEEIKEIERIKSR